jgi:Clp amino terminal domain, pathogenicity island component
VPKATTVRFSDEIYARLDQASSRTGLPVNSIVVAACLEWMERHTPSDLARLSVFAPPPRWSTIRRAVELAATKRPAPGMYPFDAFTESAQKLLTRAQDESSKLGFNYIGTEHILLACLGDPGSQATKILTHLGVTEDRVRPALDKLLSKRKMAKTSLIVPTSRVKKVIELAFRLCENAKAVRVSTGHVLLALAMEGEGVAAHLMTDLGAGRDALERELEQAEPEP